MKLSMIPDVGKRVRSDSRIQDTRVVTFLGSIVNVDRDSGKGCHCRDVGDRVRETRLIASGIESMSHNDD